MRFGELTNEWLRPEKYQVGGKGREDLGAIIWDRRGRPGMGRIRHEGKKCGSRIPSPVGGRKDEAA